MEEKYEISYTVQEEDYDIYMKFWKIVILVRIKKKKNAIITEMLKDILYMNQYIDHVFFILPDGQEYSGY